MAWSVEGGRGSERPSSFFCSFYTKSRGEESKEENSKTVFKIFLCCHCCVSERSFVYYPLCMPVGFTRTHTYSSLCVCVRARGQRLSRRHIAKPHSCCPGNSGLCAYLLFDSSWNSRRLRHANPVGEGSNAQNSPRNAGSV